MRVVVLCDNNSLGQVVLDSLHANGVKAWLIYTRAAQSLRYSRSTTPVMAVDGTLAMHADAIAGLINDMHNKQPIDMVLSSDVKGALVLCDIQHMLMPPTFPTPDRPTLEMLDDKWHFYHYCQKLGLPVPKTLYFDTPAIDVAKVNREIGFPVVMKPIREFGAAGVVVAQNAAELTACIACYRYSPVVIQEYIAGTDIGLSLFARDGRILCATTFYCGAKTRTGFADIPAMTALCQRIAKSTNYSGVANFDARIDPSGQISLFECNPRFFERLNAVRLAGIDFLRMGLSDMVLSNRVETVKTVYSRGDLEGMRRMLTDRVTARVMLRSWYEFLSNPGPRLMTRLNGGWKATLR